MLEKPKQAAEIDLAVVERRGNYRKRAAKYHESHLVELLPDGLGRAAPRRWHPEKRFGLIIGGAPACVKEQSRMRSSGGYGVPGHAERFRMAGSAIYWRR